jgi:hypothetical protein
VKPIALVLLLAMMAPAFTRSLPTLAPVDEAPRRPDFVAFRQQLREIIARRDTQALLRSVDPQIKIGFDGDDGIEAFKRKLESADVDLWRELDAVLALGGTFDGADAFVAPYVFSRWPEAFDSFEHVAVIGSGVRVRAKPSLDAPILAKVTHALLKLGPDGYPEGPWIGVRLPDGRAGFVASTLVRSPIDYRAYFMFADGAWRLTFFVAGD